MASDLCIGLIGGSGLGEALAANERGTPLFVETPFGKPSGPVIETSWAGLRVLVLQRHGPGHIHPPSRVPYRANIFALKQLGCTHILASGAVGSLRDEFRPRDLVIPSQIIDRTSRRENTFFENAAVHVEMAEPFCGVLRKLLIDAGATLNTPSDNPASPVAIHDHGCYVCMEGPSFSTRAESLMHRILGGDIIGMTAMPEARLAREAELPYALVALVTDYDSWRPPAKDAKPTKHQLLEEIISNLRAASANAVALMKSAVEQIAARPSVVDGCTATSALELGIWSDRGRIDAEEVDRLRPLWGKYFA
jgi:5'-methylthioadenosine phosphorylase